MLSIYAYTILARRSEMLPVVTKAYHHQGED